MDTYSELPADIAHPIDGVFTELSKAVVSPPYWVVQNFLPRGLVFVGAPPKGGKSTVLMAAALNVAGYQCKALPKFLNAVPNEGPVLVFSAEATAGELLSMVRTGFGIEPHPDRFQVLVADDPWEFRLDEPGGTDRFLHWCDIRKPKLVILDPLRNFHSQDENDSSAMYNLLRPLRQWAVENDACVVVVHHVVKKKAEDGPYSNNDLRGTGAMFGMADGVLMFTPVSKGYVDASFTFKRAPQKQCRILVASYERRNEHASEPLDALDETVKRHIAEGAANSQDLAGKLASSQIGPKRLEECVFKLKRNGWIPDSFQ